MALQASMARPGGSGIILMRLSTVLLFLGAWTPHGLLDGGLTIDYESLYAIPYVHTVGEIAQALPHRFPMAYGHKINSFLVPLRARTSF